MQLKSMKKKVICYQL